MRKKEGEWKSENNLSVAEREMEKDERTSEKDRGECERKLRTKTGSSLFFICIYREDRIRDKFSQPHSFVTILIFLIFICLFSNDSNFLYMDLIPIRVKSLYSVINLK